MDSGRRFMALGFVLLATLVGVGVVHGVWTDRWASLNASQAVAEMESLPLEFGAWHGKTVEETPAQQLLPDANQFLRRRYVNHTDGTVAGVMLTRGRPGPMVIKHLPTECYVSSGFEIVGQPKRFLSQSSSNKDPDEFWVATFKKSTDVLPVSVRVYWSWSPNGNWRTPDRPRMTFAHNPVLYKLYVVKTLVDENEAFEGAPVHDLIKELTNALRGSVFAPAS